MAGFFKKAKYSTISSPTCNTPFRPGAFAPTGVSQELHKRKAFGKNVKNVMKLFLPKKKNPT